MSPAPIGAPLPEPSLPPRKRFSDLRSVRWRIDLGILPSSPSASIEALRRVTADSRRRYASLRRRLLIDPHLPKDGNRSPDIAMDNPLSQDPDSSWGRFFRNAELDRMLNQDLSRLYPEDDSYLQTPSCQAMLRRILLLWCLHHPEYGYRQGMHELLAPLVYVLHVDLDHLSRVQNLYQNCFKDEFDGISFPESDLVSNYGLTKFTNWDTVSDKDCDFQESAPTVSSLDDLDPDTRDIFLLSDAYGAEGELGVVLADRFMEHDAYCMFDGLMNGAHGVVAMADFFSPSPAIGSSTGLPPIIEASSALYHLLSIVDSSLHSHLVELGVEPQYFALRWLRVLFGREFSLDDLLVIWDELFSSPNSTCIDNDAEYSFKVLSSPRGAFIAAMAVSVLLHLRSSLLATEHATSCLQRLLNFPKNVDINKLIEKAKSLQVLAFDSNFSSSSSQRSPDRNKLAVSRGYSLPTSLASPKTPLHPLPDSYWEEKWRVLHKAEPLLKGSNYDSVLGGTIKKALVERCDLSRTESDPSPTKPGSEKKESRSSVRRRLLDDLSQGMNSEADHGKSECEEVPGISNKESVSVEVDAGNDIPEEPADKNIIGRMSDCMAEEACLSGENSSVFSMATSPNNSMGNDHENDSEKSSVTSNSFIGDNDEEIIRAEECCNHSDDNQPVQDSVTTAPATIMPETDASLKQVAVSRERRPLSGKFQWFWKFGRGSGEGNVEKGGSEDLQRSPGAGNVNKDVLGSSASDGCCNSGVSRKKDLGDMKVMGTLKNLGQSMLENIQVIEAVFQQDRGQSGSQENSSNNILGGKGQVTAISALKELRKISNILCEM
ncbi:TBC1 domain family member 5-like [Phoenix dactylifera]|uniref:TBC1 domain family member 5-like n=1 Tax=Phoenix dactylifera TaxID=42345 RepID=A0A8B7CFF7_PHODC|nr:TBC1 domain family member 5-like [Phoenix dactylifera]